MCEPFINRALFESDGQNLKRDIDNNQFNQKILVTQLKKNTIYKENAIMQSLYKSATDQQIPANTIVEFAGIYGFQAKSLL